MKKSHESTGESMDKNFLLISLEEQKAKKIAEVISNDTSRKIIDFLTTKDATETELSKELKIPLSTVHYNLKQLQEAGLVIVDEFHYSSKGKEINHYKLANKYIIIAPKTEARSKFMEALRGIIPLAIITAGVGVILGLWQILTHRVTSMGAGSAKMAAYSMDVANQESGQVMMARSFETMPQTTQTFTATSDITLISIGIIAVFASYFAYLWLRKSKS